MIYVEGGRALVVYYSLRPTGHPVFWVNPPSQTDVKKSVTLAILSDIGQEKYLEKLLSGHWQAVDRLQMTQSKFAIFRNTPPQVVAYRRIQAPS